MHLSLVSNEKQSPGSRRVFVTRPLPRSDQFDAWREFNAEIIDLLPAGRVDDGFDVEHCMWTLGDLVLSRAALPDTVGREWRHRSRSYLDHWCVVVAREGNGQGGVTSTNIGVRSLTRPFHGYGRDLEVTCLYVPRDRLPRHLAASDHEGAVNLTAGVQGILSGHLDSLVRQIDNVPSAAWLPLADATCALLTACLMQTPDRVADAETPIFSALRERARKIVAANMASPEFGPGTLARLLFVSRSKLYRIFEADGGVARFIQRERLAEADRKLTEATGRISISSLSLEVGFRDHAAFSRAYKSEYGISPREARDNALAELLVKGPLDPGEGRVARHHPATLLRASAHGSVRKAAP